MKQHSSRSTFLRNMGQRLAYAGVWLRRIGHCRGFGIQSPNDYWFVRYVVNEHWPYYAYDTMGQGDDWLTRKLGRLYFRLANWRQPRVIVDSDGSDYWQNGCRGAGVVADTPADGPLELVRLRVGQGDCRASVQQLLAKADAGTVAVLEGIARDRQLWRSVAGDERTGVTFDLYYCGIVFFDKQRYKQNYIINF